MYNIKGWRRALDAPTKSARTKRPSRAHLDGALMNGACKMGGHARLIVYLDWPGIDGYADSLYYGCGLINGILIC